LILAGPGIEFETIMQNLGWQDVVALAVVLSAAAYLTRLAWRALAGKRDEACGTGCARCSERAAAGPSIPEQLVSIGAPGPRPER
jgi:hypothetical protein